MKLRLATRGSNLAWTQSGQVADALRANGHEVELVKITTHGDVTSAPRASLGGAGVFVAAVRAAVLSGECDLAVHSFKDLPTAPVADLALAAVPPREDPADVLCSADGCGLAALPFGGRVGTGSPRRSAQLLALRPDLRLVEIRGNVETRLARTSDDLDAVLLAAAGLRRIGLADRISERLEPDIFLPAPSQGALAIECRSDAAEVLGALAALDDPPSRLAALAERTVLSGLQAGCAAPVGAYAWLDDTGLQLRAMVTSIDGTRRLHHAGHTRDLSITGATMLGDTVVTRLLADGAADLVDLRATKAKPLAGRRLLLPMRVPAGLPEALRSAGALITQVEFTHQEPLPLAALEAALTDFDWVAVSSSATVDALVGQGFDLRRLCRPGSRLAAVGPATAAALQAAGLLPDLVPATAGGAALAAALPAQPATIVLIGAQSPSPEPAASLLAQGWTVRPASVYRTVAGGIPPAVSQAWPHFDAVIATAGSVARQCAALGLPGAPVIAIGVSTAEAAQHAGLQVIGVAPEPTTGGLVDAVLAALG